jgi:hypothetical protein
VSWALDAISDPDLNFCDGYGCDLTGDNSDGNATGSSSGIRTSTHCCYQAFSSVPVSSDNRGFVDVSSHDDHTRNSLVAVIPFILSLASTTLYIRLTACLLTF